MEEKEIKVDNETFELVTDYHPNKNICLAYNLHKEKKEPNYLKENLKK